MCVEYKRVCVSSLGRFYVVYSVYADIWMRCSVRRGRGARYIYMEYGFVFKNGVKAYVVE